MCVEGGGGVLVDSVIPNEYFSCQVIIDAFFYIFFHLRTFINYKISFCFSEGFKEN